MRRIVYGLLLLCMVAVLLLGAVGCGKIDTMGRIKKNGEVIMGTNAEFPPFEMRDGDKIVGIDPEIAQAIADKLGVKLRIEDMSFDALQAALKSGKVDFIAAGFTVTPDREKEVDFSTKYFKAVQAIMVMNNNTDIKSRNDLNGKRIGVQAGTTGESLFLGDNKVFNASGLSSYPKGADAILDLKNGKIDAIVLDNYTSMALADLNPEVKILSDPAADPEEYAIAVRKGDQDLLNVINDTFKELKDSGKLDQIFKKYIPDYRPQ